jgi:hypothetical protein
LTRDNNLYGLSEIVQQRILFGRLVEDYQRVIETMEDLTQAIKCPGFKLATRDLIKAVKGSQQQALFNKRQADACIKVAQRQLEEIGKDGN